MGCKKQQGKRSQDLENIDIFCCEGNMTTEPLPVIPLTVEVLS
jgi:hypothetical protein